MERFRGTSWPREGSVWFLPTGAFALMRLLHAHFAQHRLLLADFDMVPQPSPGRWAPIVMRGGAATFTDYLAAPIGTTDMVFPTDFSVLAALWQALAARSGAPRARAELRSTEEFMSVYADVKRTRTRDGYNPLLRDYANTQFLLTRRA